MNAYARLAIFLGIAIAILVFATQHALHRGNEMAALLAENPAGKARLSSASRSSSGTERSSSGSASALQKAASFQTPAQGEHGLIAQLEATPAGPEAIALTQALERGITPENAGQYVQAFLTTQNPAVQRGTQAALARTADSATITQIAQSYGSIPEQSRGRILQLLESVQNPAALQGLVHTAQSDTSEKGSPILGSAMHGMAHLGTNESVAYLLSQLSGDREFFALQSLARVTTPEGLATMAGAVAGNKDGTGLDSGRIQQVAGILNQSHTAK